MTIKDSNGVNRKVIGYYYSKIHNTETVICEHGNEFTIGKDADFVDNMAFLTDEEIAYICSKIDRPEIAAKLKESVRKRWFKIMM